MPGKGNGMGKGNGKGRMGDEAMTGRTDDGMHGRSESSPGHLKRAAGAQSARDFAPGRAGKAGRGTLPESAPDEMAED